jgi:hypothetical protein
MANTKKQDFIFKQLDLTTRSIFKFIVIFCLLVAIPASTALITEKVDTLTTALLIPAFIYYVIFNLRSYKSAQSIPYLALALHATSYMIVNLSFWLAALFVYLQNGSLDLSFKYTIPAMGIFWGINLLIHCLASFAGSGFEEAKTSTTKKK